MIGCVDHVFQHGRTSIGLEKIGGLTVMRACLYVEDPLTKRGISRQMRRVGSVFQRNGVKRLLLGDGFQYSQCLSGWEQVDPLPFYYEIADLLVLEKLRCKGIQPYRATVLISAARMSSEVRKAAERLCSRVRVVRIDIPKEGGQYAEWLHRTYGLPVSPPLAPDVTLAFCPPIPEGENVISLWEGDLRLGGVRIDAPEVEASLHWGDRLLAALWECGRLKRESLRVWTPGTPLTNQDKVNIIP